MKKGERKKILALFMIIIVSFSVGGAVTILGIGQNVESSYNVNYEDSNGTGSVNGVNGIYDVKIQSNTNWVAYIIIDGHNIQKSGNSNTTIDLGNVSHYASITIDQTGIGTTTATLEDSNGHVVDTDNTNEAETNTLFMYLRMSDNENS